MEKGNEGEKTQIKLSHKEVVEALIKAKGITEGIWSLGFQFHMRAGIITDQELGTVPTSFNSITAVTLSRVEKENDLSVDAAKVTSRIITAH